jgi:hypothetical protein
MPRVSASTAEVAAAPIKPLAQETPRKRRKGKRTQSRQVTIKSRAIEPMEQQIGQDRPRVLKTEGPARDALEPALVQPVDRPVDPEKIEMLKFMAEKVEVLIHTTSDPNADQVFEVFNNGDRELFKRGEKKVVQRRFVNELAMRKITTYSQEVKPDAYGVPVQIQVPRTSLRYPFSVVRDDHPRGPDWLKYALAAA